MKVKHSLLLIALGFCLGYVGTLGKIIHRSEANTLLILSTVCKVVGVLVLVLKVIRYEGFRKFMNS